MGKASEVAEIAPSYVFLAFQDVSLYIGQCLYPNMCMFLLLIEDCSNIGTDILSD